MRRVFAALLAVSLLLALCAGLAGCSGIFGGDNEIQAPDGDAVPTETPSATPEVITDEPALSGDGVFSLRYNPSATLNPITGTDASNMALATLMYEGLFVLGEDLSYENVLCESFSTSDAITYELVITTGVYMSDGTELSPYDVVYSLNQARQSTRYKSRLSNVQSVSVTGEGAVKVVLAKADARFPALLDIPVIKDGSSGTAPRGTGPYVYAGDDGTARLIKNEFYRSAATLPVEEIYLIQSADAELGELFTESIIDVFIEDPNAPVSSVRRDHEVRYYNTTVLQYIGFNPRTAAIGDAKFRSVIDMAVDRSSIVNDILGTRASEARVALPSYYKLYDATWESSDTRDRLVAMSQVLGQIGMQDANNDTHLEYPTADGLLSFSLVFIVNEENEKRVLAAEQVTNTLRRVGIDVELRSLPYDEYTAALKSGDFDMYYGETRLSANFDLSPLIAPGGSLDYGGMGTSVHKELNDKFLAARGDFAEQGAARDLCTALARELPFVPVAYKQYAVHSGRNEIRGIEPSQTGLYWNIYEWTIDVK